MAVVVNADMPNNCLECNFMNCVLPYKKNTNREIIKKQYTTNRHPECPIICEISDEMIELLQMKGK